MPKSKRVNTHKIVVAGPSLSVDGEEILGFKQEFVASYNQRKLSVSELRELALSHHSTFVQKVSKALSKASGSQERNGTREPSDTAEETG